MLEVFARPLQPQIDERSNLEGAYIRLGCLCAAPPLALVDDLPLPMLSILRCPPLCSNSITPSMLDPLRPPRSGGLPAPQIAPSISPSPSPSKHLRPPTLRTRYALPSALSSSLSSYTHMSTKEDVVGGGNVQTTAALALSGHPLPPSLSSRPLRFCDCETARAVEHIPFRGEFERSDSQNRPLPLLQTTIA